MTFSGPSSFIVWSRFQFHQIKLGNLIRFQHDGHISWLRNEISNHLHNIASIANAVPVTLYSRVTMNVEIVVLNCQSLLSCSLRVFWKCAIVNMSTCKITITIARGSQHSQAAAMSGRQPGILSIELVARDGWSSAPHKFLVQPPFFLYPSFTSTSEMS